MINFLQNLKSNIKNWWIYIFNGILLIIAGAGMLFMPEAAYNGLGLLFAVTLLIGGLASIIFGYTNRKALVNWGHFLAGGVVQVGASIFLFMNPGIQGASLAVLLGLFLLYHSALLISNSVDMRNLGIKGHGWVLLAGLAAFALSIAIFGSPSSIGLGVVVGVSAITFMAIGADFIWLGSKLNRARVDINTFKKQVGEELKAIKEKVEKDYPGAEEEFKEAWREVIEFDEELTRAE